MGDLCNVKTKAWLRGNKRRVLFLAALLAPAIVALGAFQYYSNYAIELSRYHYQAKKVPQAFDGLRFLQISDLHNVELGKQNERLLAFCRNEQADVIVITGDMVDRIRPDVSVALALARELVKLTPQVFYVTGNHECSLSQDLRQQLLEGLRESGVTVLSNQSVPIMRDGERIHIIGLDDSSLTTAALAELTATLPEQELRIVLAHEPQLLEHYAASGADLVFSGHAHGGQIRLPGLPGLFAPEQGFFPEFTCGIYTEGATTMVVSRGLGNSVLPLRVMNRPDLVLCELHSA